MEKSNTRHHFNEVILNKLSKLNDKHPDFRFIQLLWACGIIRTDNKGEMLDDFYEEPQDTWKRMNETYFLKGNENN